eukprot:m.43223 g.43223  ORF g.43223 m.43223 type:complete len:76 (-) comp12193_c0_seq2:600-827(-)
MLPRQLYKQFVREAMHFGNYNIQRYVLRRVRSSFREKVGGAETDAALQYGHEQLEILKRQGVISRLNPSPKPVVN